MDNLKDMKQQETEVKEPVMAAAAAPGGAGEKQVFNQVPQAVCMGG